MLSAQVKVHKPWQPHKKHFGESGILKIYVIINHNMKSKCKSSL